MDSPLVASKKTLSQEWESSFGSPPPGGVGCDDAEPSTQPMVTDDADDMTDMDDSQEEPTDAMNFGHLIQMKPRGPMVAISKEKFLVGRSVRNDHVVQHSAADLTTVSKMHFEIHSDPLTNAVYIVDKSSNGTFLNERKICKGRKEMLPHNAFVSMTGPKLRHFVYLSANRDYQKQYPSALRKKYIISRELGKGACGTVMLGVRRDDHLQVAIKAINRSKVSMMPGGAPKSNVLNEVRLLQAIDHPCIIRLEDVVDAGNDLYIVLELAPGGELFEKIIEKTKLAEQEAKLYFYQMVSAIDYLHKNNICHRDLKPENILLCGEDDENPIIKVTDLGLSKFVDVHTHLKTFCGTPQYLAPEVLFSRVRGDGSYDMKVDMWSLGVILYILLSGCPPFNPDKVDKPLIRQVTEGDYSFPPQHWSKISKEAVDLVKKLMTLAPKSRLSAAQTLQHPWMMDAAVVEKAERLMDTQRRGTDERETTTLLKGILPEELEEIGPPVIVAPPVHHNSSEKNGETGESAFKRPLDEKLAPACKRFKMKKE